MKSENIDTAPDTTDYLRLLVDSQPLRAPVVRAAVRAFAPAVGSGGLDVGCGAGHAALALAEAVGAAGAAGAARGDGHVTGVDIEPAFLAHAQALADEAGLAARVAFRAGDMLRLPFDDDSFDWAWSMDSIGHHPAGDSRAIDELVRVVRPGGAVALLAWSSQQALPGFPGLEARLNAATARVSPLTAGRSPRHHFPRSLGRLRAAGLIDCGARTFAGDAHAPLNDAHRRALADLFAMLWEPALTSLTDDDRAAYRRLCRPESAEFILDEPDYYACFTYSMFHGWVADEPGSSRTQRGG